MKFYALVKRTGAKKTHVRTARTGARYDTACGQSIPAHAATPTRSNSAASITCYDCLIAGASGRFTLR